jgi:hypothetical protein
VYDSNNDTGTACLKACFDVATFLINGTKYNISSTKFLQGLCFQVDYSSGGAVQGNAKANASILISTGPDQESLTFNLTLELQYISNIESVSWTWNWTRITVQQVGSQEQAGPLSEVILFQIEDTYQNWKVSLDQYFSCEDGVHWNSDDSSSTINLTHFAMSAGGLVPYCKQREMLCKIPKTDQIVSLCLSGLFTAILVVSTSVNFVWRVFKRNKAKRESERERIDTSNSTNYQTI